MAYSQDLRQRVLFFVHGGGGFIHEVRQLKDGRIIGTYHS